MSACWMFIMILMGCRSSRATTSTCVCNDEPKAFCVPPGGEVYVPCLQETALDVRFSLFKGEEMLNNHSCSHGEACMPSTNRVMWELRKNTNNSSGFMLINVNASSSGTYRCDVTVMFPPPLKTVHSPRILVLVDGDQCKKNCTNVTKAAEPPHREFHWIWISGITSLYSIIVTIVAVLIWVKLRKTDSQSDYMNTKPRATRDRKKNRQKLFVQRHF